MTIMATKVEMAMVDMEVLIQMRKWKVWGAKLINISLTL